MTLFDLILIAVSLSMDAFAVSICKGLSVRRVATLTHALTCGLWFGGFQFLMPTLGVFSGRPLCRGADEIRPLDRLRAAGAHRCQHGQGELCRR